MRLLLFSSVILCFFLYEVSSLSIHTRNGTFEAVDHGLNRIEINQFISVDEARICTALLDAFGLLQKSPGVSSLRIDEIVAHFMKYGTHASQLGKSSGSTVEEKKTVYAPQLRNDKWVSTWIDITTRIQELLDAYFGSSYIVGSGYLFKHEWVESPLSVRYPGVNLSAWAVEPHSDHCSLVLDSAHGLHCSAPPVRSFDVGVIVYLNKVRGGNSVFLDMPFGKKGLVDTSSSARFGTTVYDTKTADLTSVLRWTTPVVIKTDVGKLFFYDSGVETLHGVAALKGPEEVRYSLVYYFKKKS